MQAPTEKFTRKIHATDVSETHFAWENGNLKLPPGSGPRHAKNSRDEVPPFGTPFLTPIFGPGFGPRGSPAGKIHAKNSRDALGHSRAPFLVAFGPWFGPSLASPSELAFGTKTGSQTSALRRVSTISAHSAQEGDIAFGVIGYRLWSGGVLEARTP